MTTLLIATRNAHKVGEIQAILGPGFRCLTLTEFAGAPPVVEDANTFAGNATKKASELARWLGQANASSPLPDYVLADDSGLEVDALDGAPGVNSARFAAMDSGQSGNSPDAANNAKLLRLLVAVPPAKRTARFHCTLVLVRLSGEREPGKAELFDGVCEGRIQSTASGKGGFGYDPLFIPNGYTQSFAELGEEIKNQISHRSRALAKLCLRFQQR